MFQDAKGLSYVSSVSAAMMFQIYETEAATMFDLSLLFTYLAFRFTTDHDKPKQLEDK